VNGLSLPYGDVKFLWEPARFGWAFTLGRAFHLTSAEKYARAFWKYFDRFDSANPPFQGPHWVSGQEVAIRLMALVWSAQVFAHAKASTTARLARLAIAIAHHAVRIPPTLVYARSQANNHLVTEAVALYVAGAALDHKPWRTLGWRWLNRALQRQISSYGEYIQHSVNYHRLMLHSALLADSVRRGRSEQWPAASRQALTRASHWLFSMVDPISGSTPNLGANDGALLLPLASAAFPDFRPTVQAAARAFLRADLPPGDWDELSLWLGLPAASHAADSTAYAAEHLRGKNSWVYLHASQFRSRLGHMDQLHLDLWWRGLNLLSDAGTVLYNAPPPWNNPLVSSAVHNLVSPDGREQMTRAGRFIVLDWFPAVTKRVLALDPSVVGRLVGSHRGYERLGIRYERSVTLLQRERWRVRDELIFTRPRHHPIRLHWLVLDGQWTLRQTGMQTRLRLRTPLGWITLEITGQGLDAAPEVTLIRAGKTLLGPRPAQPYEGFLSRTYAEKVPALSLSLDASASRSCSFTTEIILPR
jgi:hypothetical protein